MEHRELLEQHEGRLRLYVQLLGGLQGSSFEPEARDTLLDLVRKEIDETDRIAEAHVRKLADEDEREAFRYAMMLLLPYYTNLARLYGRKKRGSGPPRIARVH